MPSPPSSSINAGKSDSGLIIYVIIVILYIEIFLFMFNPKIKTQILFCSVPVTVILFVVILSNAMNKDLTVDKKLAGWFIGIITIITCVGILNTALSEHKTNVKSSTGENGETKLSKKNTKTIVNIKGAIISNLIITAIIGFIIAPDTKDQIEQIKELLVKIGTFMNIDKIPSDYSGLITSKDDIINFINAIGYAPLKYILYTFLFILAPLGLIAFGLKYLTNMLINNPNVAFYAGISYIFGSSIYIITESTRLIRVVIPE